MKEIKEKIKSLSVDALYGLGRFDKNISTIEKAHLLVDKIFSLLEAKIVEIDEPIKKIESDFYSIVAALTHDTVKTTDEMISEAMNIAKDSGYFVRNLRIKLGGVKVQNSPNCKTCNGSGEIKTECPNGCQGPDDYCSLCCNDYQDDLFGYVFEPCPDCQHSKFAKWYEA